MIKVRTKGESNQITLAVFRQLNKEQRENLLNGSIVGIYLNGKTVKIKWERETGYYSKEK